MLIDDMCRNRRNMFEILNDLSELIYVVDMETYELLFMNTVGKELFHIDAIQGEKCYKVLQCRDEPCSFCTNSILSADRIYTWEHKNEITGRHYLLKDRIIKWEGKDARVEIAFDITEKEEQKISLENALSAEKMVMECVKQLYSSKEMEKTIHDVLGKIGSFLAAERVYIFQFFDGKMHNTYEWCEQGILPQIENLQELDIGLIDRWKPYFSEHECVIIEDLEAIKEEEAEEYEALSVQGIYSLVAAPLEKDSELIGYIGVDNPPMDKIQNITSLFHTFRYFLMSAIRIHEDEKLLLKLSYRDMLTGAFNRNRYMKDIDELSGKEMQLGIVYMDVNGLKDMNDQRGHSFGDKVLVQCADRAVSVFGPEKLYRIGGDEFIILCKDIAEAEFLKLVTKLKNLCEDPESFTASIGYKWDKSTHKLQEMTCEADNMMYEEKKKYYRRNLFTGRYRHFNEDVYGLGEPGMIQKLLLEKRFLVYLQPKMSFQDSSLVGAEALIRYHSKEDIIIEPARFLPLLEDTKLISLIDFFVFEFICSLLASWLEKEKNVVPIAVNFSRNTLLETDFINRLIQICERYKVDRKWLEIEITESADTSDRFDLSKFVEEIRSAGFYVAMDDFGVQFANISLLISVNYDKLKVDKSLIDAIDTNARARSALRALVSLCKDSGTKTTVEGVETKEQFEALREMGFDEMQGYLISQPVPIDQFEEKYM